MHLHIVAPSGAIDPLYIDQASERLRSWGWCVTEGQYARGKEGRFAATDEQRLCDLQEAFLDEQTDAILCARGGYGLQRLVHQLSHVPIRPKTLIGFSDITILHQLFLLKDIPTIHGLMCKHIASLSEDALPILQWKQAVEQHTLSYHLPTSPLSKIGGTQGVVIGGNLSVLYGLQGTELSLNQLIAHLQAKQLPIILFLEDVGERHYHIERMMLNLQLSGVFDHIQGLIIGQFADCEDDPSMGETIYQTIQRIIQPYSFPTLFDFPAGHIEQNMPLLFGRKASMNIQNTTTLLTYE